MKKFLPDISVIIPMYNAEKYIDECLQSLLKQTFQNFEVIVVDDCSTDNSVRIVENLQKNFEGRLKIISTEKNSGWASVPRNLGLSVAKGKYVTFMDNDDFMEPDALNELYETAEKFNADVVHPEKCILQFENNGSVRTEIGSLQRGDFVTKATLETFNLDERMKKFTNKQTHWWIWNKFYRRDFLVRNDIKFPESTSFEDFIFSLCCIVLAKNYVRVPNLFYHWRVYDSSTSHKEVDGVTMVSRIAEVVKHLDKFMCSQEFFTNNPEQMYALLDFFVQERLNVFAKAIFMSLNSSAGEIYDLLRKHVFAKNSAETSAFTAYLFVESSIFKLFSQKQTEEIEDLKNQLAKFQNQN